MKKNMRAILKGVEIHHIVENNPILDYLDQFKDSTDEQEQEYYVEDQKRLNSYGGKWYQFGVEAVATIHLPFEVITGKGKEINYKIQKIGSGGLWAIESDSEKDYIKEIELGQIDKLKDWLKMLNVDFAGYDFSNYTVKERY